MNKKQLREELLMDMQEIRTAFDMGYFEYDMKLDLYSIENALYDLDNKQYEVKHKQKNKIKKYKKDVEFKIKDRNKTKTTWKERDLKRCLRKKAERKVRRTPVGQENFALRGCGYHKVYEWSWDMD